MLNCQQCTREQFCKAMKIVKMKPIEHVPTDLLYIALTEYIERISSDIGRVTTSDYDFERFYSLKTKINTFGSELLRRGIRVMY